MVENIQRDGLDNCMRLTGTTHISYAHLLRYYKCYRWKCVDNSTREFDMFVNMHHFMCICLTVT